MSSGLCTISADGEWLRWRKSVTGSWKLNSAAWVWWDPVSHCSGARFENQLASDRKAWSTKRANLLTCSIQFNKHPLWWDVKLFSDYKCSTRLCSLCCLSFPFKSSSPRLAALSRPVCACLRNTSSSSLLVFVFLSFSAPSCSLPENKLVEKMNTKNMHCKLGAAELPVSGFC